MISPLSWISGVAVLCVNKAFASNIQKGNKMGLPGDFGFEPLRLHPKDGTDQKGMQLAKIKHGQFSMMTIPGFANQ